MLSDLTTWATIIIIGLVTFMFTNWFGSKVVPEDVEAPGKEGHS